MRLAGGVGIVLIGLIPAAVFAQPRITRVSASSVQLQAGGAPISVTIEGENMASVSAVELLLGGRPVIGLTGVVRPARSLTRTRVALAVELTAEAAAGAGTYQLALVAGRQRIQVPVSVVVVAESTPLQPAPTVGGTVDVSPSITGAAPGTLSLAVGGPPQTVVLTGVRLNAVTGAHVERNGSRLAGIQVQLPGSTDPARREVRLTATASAGPPWDVPLDLIVQSRLGTLVKSITVPVQITAAAPPNVDLVVIECTLEPGPNRLETRGSIRNDGTGVARFEPGQYMARSTFSGVSASPSNPVRNHPLAGAIEIPPGAVKTMFSGIFYIPSAEKPTVTWQADPGGVIDDMNPANNERTCAMLADTPPPAGTPVPDVLIAELSVEPNSGPADTRFAVTVTVRNAGTGPVAQVQSVEIRCTIDSIDGARSLHTGVPALAAGETMSRSFIVSDNYTPGAKTLECMVDPLRTFYDASRTNNARSLLFYVTGL